MKHLVLTVFILMACFSAAISQSVVKTGPQAGLQNYFDATSKKQPYELTKQELAKIFTPELVAARSADSTWPNMPTGRMKDLRIGKFKMENDSSASVNVNFLAFPGDRRDNLFKFKKVAPDVWRISDVIGKLGKKITWSLLPDPIRP